MYQAYVSVDSYPKQFAKDEVAGPYKEKTKSKSIRWMTSFIREIVANYKEPGGRKKGSNVYLGETIPKDVFETLDEARHYTIKELFRQLRSR